MGGGGGGGGGGLHLPSHFWCMKNSNAHILYILFFKIFVADVCFCDN